MATIAPLDRLALESALEPFGRSTTLPGAAYTSPEVFAWEMEHFFQAGWVCVGRASDLHPGSRRAVPVGGEGILLTRDDSGTLRGFFNVCRHRGHELLPLGGSAEGRLVQCPYHGWTYQEDGRLKSAPRLGPRPGFTADDHGLVPVAVEEWRGWIFANVTGGAPSVPEYVGDLESLVRPHDPGGLVVGARMEYVASANWKLLVENYHECYHCTQIHPELCLVTPPTSGANYRPSGLWVGGVMDLMEHAQTMSLTGASQAPPLPGLDEGQRRHVYYLGLFPNLLLSLHPDYVLSHRLEPIAPDRTRVECELLWPPEVIGQAGFDPSYALEFWDVTNKQDWHACESVQRGVSSRAYRPGPIARPEDAVYQFVTMVASAYLDGEVKPPR